MFSIIFYLTCYASVLQSLPIMITICYLYVISLHNVKGKKVYICCQWD